MKVDREAIYRKYNGHCAYCGAIITIQQMQVDHIIALKKYDVKCLTIDLNGLENLNPACRVCNKWKSVFTVEEFRHEIQRQVERCRAYSRNFRMAWKFGLVQEIKTPVRFYFEKINEA